MICFKVMMKKTFLIWWSCWGLLAQFTMGQSLIGIYSNTDSGRNLGLSLAFDKGKFQLGGGVQYNINRLAHPDNLQHLFRNRLYATKAHHFVALNAFLHRKINYGSERVTPFVFYDVQARYSGTRTRFFLPEVTIPDTTGNLPPTILYKEHIVFFGPYTWVEQTLGVGLQIDFKGKWFLIQKVGYGTNFILGKDPQLASKIFRAFTWEFAALASIGAGIYL